MKIITEFVAPSMTTKMYDWIAYREGTEEDGPHGRGASEKEALRDLCEKLAEMLAPAIPPLSMDAIYAAWHGAGLDLAGGNWKLFVSKLMP